LLVRLSFYRHFFQDIHVGQEEIVKFVFEGDEFEIRIGYWFVQSSFLLFFFLEADFV